MGGVNRLSSWGSIRVSSVDIACRAVEEVYYLVLTKTISENEML
jgi:hypothetical protein